MMVPLTETGNTCCKWPVSGEGIFDHETAKRVMAQLHQTPTSTGQVDKDRSVVVSADPDGDWTVWTFYTNGMACPTAAGSGWEPGTLPEAEGQRT